MYLESLGIMYLETNGRNGTEIITVAFITSGELIKYENIPPQRAHTKGVNSLQSFFSLINIEFISTNNLKCVIAIVKIKANDTYISTFSTSITSELRIMYPRKPARYAIPNTGRR